MKNQKKGKGSNNDIRTILRIPATVNSALATKVSANVKGFTINGGKTKVIEETGKVVTSGLSKENPYKQPGCPYQDKCPTTPRQDCSTTNVSYEVTCLTCSEEGREDSKSIYVGCSGKSQHVRSSDHKKDALNRDNKNPMAMSKHISRVHNNVPQPIR